MLSPLVQHTVCTSKYPDLPLRPVFFPLNEQTAWNTELEQYDGIPCVQNMLHISQFCIVWIWATACCLRQKNKSWQKLSQALYENRYLERKQPYLGFLQAYCSAEEESFWCRETENRNSLSAGLSERFLRGHRQQHLAHTLDTALILWVNFRVDLRAKELK